MVVIDAKHIVLGRLGTVVAKRALQGQQVDVINCELSIITGRKNTVLQHQRQKLHRGTHKKGPFYFRSPEQFVKRSIRGMVPKKATGVAAFDRIKCHIGVPKQFESEKPVTLSASADKSNAAEYVTVAEICKLIGGK